MRIRKRTPARASSPPPRATVAPPPLPPPRQPKETPVEEEAPEREDEVLAASKNSGAEDVAKPEPRDAVRCSRNDGKRWRCKNAAAPGYVFCDQHIAWSTRKHKTRKKRKQQREDGEPTETGEEEEAVRTGDNGDDDPFCNYGGFRLGCLKTLKREAKEEELRSKEGVDSSNGVA